LRLLENPQCRLSISRTGNCYDDDVMESFLATLKGEYALSSFGTRAEVRSAIFELIELWYNRLRLHFALGYLSPLNLNKL
jgi:transposase InsO family protein